MKIICTIYRDCELMRRALYSKKKAIGLIRTKIIPTYMSWFANQCDLVLAPSAGMQKILWEYGMRSRSAVFPTGLEKSFFAMDEQKAKGDQEDV